MDIGAGCGKAPKGERETKHHPQNSITATNFSKKGQILITNDKNPFSTLFTILVFLHYSLSKTSYFSATWYSNDQKILSSLQTRNHQKNAV